ncbi:MAG: L,D-transpeptidase family protein [Chitinispirillaceae bacterium]
MALVEKDQILCTYPISTSRFGIGSKEGSFMTPPGIHQVASKVGAGAPPYRIFRSRVDTGITWTADIQEENLILTRIIRLKGCEKGVNKEGDIDSFKRYIYIHGTNREECIGTPLSHGCVCMRNEDIIELFDRIQENDLVIIDPQ